MTEAVMRSTLKGKHYTHVFGLTCTDMYNMTLRIQVVGTFSNESPKGGVTEPYSNPKLFQGETLRFEIDTRSCTTGKKIYSAPFA